jgi:uncharacterized protein YaaN involved in tellurite resistance
MFQNLKNTKRNIKETIEKIKIYQQENKKEKEKGLIGRPKIPD